MEMNAESISHIGAVMPWLTIVLKITTQDAHAMYNDVLQNC
jgi:hypothetical protein